MLDCSMETEEGEDGGQQQAASNRGPPAKTRYALATGEGSRPPAKRGRCAERALDRAENSGDRREPGQQSREADGYFATKT